MQSFNMHKYLSVMLLFFGPAWAQIPARNCMSNPMMDGCPAAEQAGAGAGRRGRARPNVQACWRTLVK